MKVFVTGVGGQLGHDVMNELHKRGYEGVGSDIAPVYSGVADGSAVTSMPYNEQIFIIDDEVSTTKFIPRETLRRVATPQAYKFGKLDWAYHEAFEKEIGIYGSHYTNTMMVELGERLYFAAGSDRNIKLTTKGDLELFKAYLNSDKATWLK